MQRAQHPKSAYFVRQKLFVGLITFSELEARITALPDERIRGDAFEVFAEAYIATQRKHDAANVWPLPSVPTSILQTLGLAAQDYGVDGVFRSVLGNYNAYQVKFRSRRPALSWRELSTFMGLADSPNIHSRVLLTNCDALPSVLNERQGFFCIRGTDLDRLEAHDFRAIEAWLADSVFSVPKKQPQPHQVEALDALLPALDAHNRVSAIMACGTGKTLVALWVAERRQAKIILVLVPSLALLRQILHEWLRETSLPNLVYLCVCSDPTVKEGADAITATQADLDFQVSTNAGRVREFLDAAFTGTKIVFSTYQSAKVVGEAMKPDEVFDLAIFDEAHKTAGREGRNYAFALEDKNLPIRKRIFFTATPRHYNPQKCTAEGDAQLVFSMDRPEIYGPQAYRLTFAEAARRGIICGYKVIFSVITSEMVTNELLSHGEVLVNGDTVRARQVANQIALRDAIEKYKVRKVFTFHNTVNAAASFVAAGSEGARTHLPDFATFHVNGKMTTSLRESEMREFRVSHRAIMSNARCLTEGVDVPAVDMVAFLSPRRSRVDIVQATGRAMRVSPSTGKTTGYILVPLYVELTDGETVEEAVNRADFNEIWDVLQSLQEQDDVFAELIRNISEQTDSWIHNSQLSERVDVVGVQVGLETLIAAVTTRCFEGILSSWHKLFGKLKAYRERIGDCNVPARWPENRQLSNWVIHQRTYQKAGTILAERQKALTEIGFEWEPEVFAERWRLRFDELKLYKERFGDCNVPMRWPENPQLGQWVTNQRAIMKAGALAAARQKVLNEIGFDWEPEPKFFEDWKLRFIELKLYKERFGDCNVPMRWPENPQLGQWVSTQRRTLRGNRLHPEHQQRLDEIGFVWGQDKATMEWHERFEQLKLYKKQFGDCSGPFQSPEYPKLGRWVIKQRYYQKRSNLSAEHESLLNEIGFVWAGVNIRENWNRRLEQLKLYRERFGDCNVPNKWDENLQLASWVNNQRAANRRGRLSLELKNKLNEIGFDWNPQSGSQKGRRDESWELRFGELKLYKERFGDCNVPMRWPENPQLGQWVSTQRRTLRGNRLHPEHESLLNEIGFRWSKTRT